VTPRKRKPPEPEGAARRRQNVQALFERMADEYRGTVALERWFPDGSAKVTFTGSGHYDAVVRIAWADRYADGAPPLVAVTPVPARHAPTVLVSPVASAVIAVATR